MKEINIAHLYYDVLNLYGENGNIKALKKQFEQQNLKVNIYFLTIMDKIDFNKFDLIYISSGTEEAINLVSTDICKYKKEIKEYIENKKYFIVTGNAINLFGKYILLEDNSIIKTLDIFNFYTKEEKFRIVGEVLYKTNLIKEDIIGFQNRNTSLFSEEESLFEVIKGTGSNIESKQEGIKYKNFYATYVLGPLLIRNPKLLEYFVKKIIKDKYKDYKLKKIDLKLETKAYNKFIENYKNKK